MTPVLNVYDSRRWLDLTEKWLILCGLNWTVLLARPGHRCNGGHAADLGNHQCAVRCVVTIVRLLLSAYTAGAAWLRPLLGLRQCHKGCLSQRLWHPTQSALFAEQIIRLV